MFPLRWNFPFRKKDGSMVNLEDVMSGGGGGGYTLPTASAETKGGVKIGSGLTMTGEVLSVTGGGGGGSVECRAGHRNFNQGGKTWNSFSVTFDTPFEDSDYIFLYGITKNSAQTETSFIPINIIINSRTASGVSGRLFNGNDELIGGTVDWIAIKV